jgi:tetratricopeptide (TPR) repeat protein
MKSEQISEVFQCAEIWRPRSKFIPYLFGIFLLCVADTLITRAAESTNSVPSENECEIVSVEGKVWILPKAVEPWQRASAGQILHIGDRLRTEKSSRAALRFSGLSAFRINELTIFELLPPPQSDKKPLLNLKSGSLYFFSREKPADVQFRTPTSSGAIRGTEFLLRASESGETYLALIDGKVDIGNEAGRVEMKAGEEVSVRPGQAPNKTALIDAVNVIQWCIYYPAVLDADEIAFSAEEKKALQKSLIAYRSGDLLQALTLFSTNEAALSEQTKIYYAALELSVGQVDEANHLLADVSTSSHAIQALREMIAAVQLKDFVRTDSPTSASEWLAESYYQQSRSKLVEALNAAQAATKISPSFGFAWIRVAELELCFGRTSAAHEALQKGLTLSPRNAQGLAVNGFLLARENKTDLAFAQFDQAIAIDSALVNAWLGRGLCKIRSGHADEGRKDLEIAATLEPHRAILRSYLGKAWSNENDSRHAEKELILAKKLDPNDPTSWLYSALLDQQKSRINEAVRDLEKSQDLNSNRSLFRSRLLLDQDQAVRSANLAGIYRDAGMFDVSVREASRAVNQDYANYSAHLFLANSYDALRDPNHVNLRFGTAFLSELLTANLLAPVSASSLSQTLSPDEYSKFFRADGIGLSSSTEYTSHGDGIQDASQYGIFGNTAYALDASYRWNRGFRPNNDLEETFFAASIKQQLTPQDSVLVQANRFDYSAGDVAQYYYQTNASQTLRVSEKQEPNIYLGYHHEWTPGSHTLLLLARLSDDFRLNDPSAPIYFLRQIGGTTTSISSRPNAVNLSSGLEAYSAELQQIWQGRGHTVIVGGRFQAGTTENFNSVSNLTQTVAIQNLEADLERFNFYGYDQWQLADWFQLTAGISYDHLRFPRDIDTSPIATGEESREQVSPKVGFIWTPLEHTHIRGAYTRSLGGLFYDNSVRLEPTEVSGFNQALRSVAPESVVGLVPGTRFETFGLGFDHRFKSNTYFGIDAELLRSEGDRTVGALTNSVFIPVPDSPASTRQSLEFEERSLTVTLNQLIGDNWSVGARYRLTHAELTGRYIDVPAAVADAAGINQNQSALLQQLNLFAIFQHRSGFFGEADAIWSHQSNSGYTPGLPDSDFWQFNIFAGYRFAHRHAEARVGVVNLTGRDYQLNPLTLHSELPRERSFVASLKFYF